MLRFLTASVLALIASTTAHAQVSESTGSESAITARASRGKGFNPDLGVNALMLYRNSNRGNDSASLEPNGVSLQEAEIQVTSDVDPYWRLVGTFSLHSEVSIDTTTTPPTRSSQWVFEPEEAFAESLDLPIVNLRVGKFKAAVGKHNQLHTHAFPFIDAPLQNSVLLGDEGLNDVGASVAVLAPVPWFSELSLQALSGQGEGLDYFQARSANAPVYVARFRNLWDLNDDLTAEIGLSAATGENAFARTTNVFEGDLTFKWRKNAAKALIWSTELLRRNLNASTDEVGQGFASWVQWQLAQRWWLQARAERLTFENQDPTANAAPSASQTKQSLLAGYIPTEFSGVRLQYDHLTDGAVPEEHKISLQLNFSIGAHPAHAY